MRYVVKKATEKYIRDHTYRKGKSGTFWVDVQLNGERIQKSLHTNDEELAIRICMRLLDTPNPPKTKTMLLSDLCRYFIENNPDKSEAYLREMKQAFRLFIETVRDIPITMVKRIHVKRFRTELLKRTRKDRHGNVVPISGYRINGIQRMLRSAFSTAVEDEILESNPFTRFKKTDVNKKDTVAFTPANYRIIKETVMAMYGKDFADVMDIYLFTGMRQSEGPKMEWKQFDLQNRILTIPADKTKKKTERRIPLAECVVEILESFKRRGLSKPIPFKSHTLSQNFGHARDGSRYHHIDFKGTGIEGTFHSLRKTTVTYLKKVGLDPDFRNFMLGHKPRDVSAEHYTDYNIAVEDGTIKLSIEKMVRLFYPSTNTSALRLVKAS